MKKLFHRAGIGRASLTRQRGSFAGASGLCCKSAHRHLAACIIGLCVFSAGCNIAEIATRNIVYETSLCCEDLGEGIRRCHLANSAWGEIQRTSAGDTYSADYARGFKAGFAANLDAGGTGEAPPIPPRRYWASRYQTSQGHQAIDDWYAGFQHGAAVAQAGDGVGVPPSDASGQETAAPSNP